MESLRGSWRLVALLAIAGCDVRNGNQVASQPAAGTAGTGRVTRHDFEARGKRWPLTVDAGTLGCTGVARWVEVDGVRYGLNGFATSERGYREIEPIWAVDAGMVAELKTAGASNDPPVRINIGDMIEEAGTLC